MGTGLTRQRNGAVSMSHLKAEPSSEKSCNLPTDTQLRANALNQGILSPPRGHLAMLMDISGCHH